ncbi:MAG: ABC transporter substrate-binding protein [Ilumatobacteraceae bacterium]
MAKIMDPRQLSLIELRALRAKLQNDDDAVSYVRRLAQARLDLVQAEKRHRLDGNTESLSDELPSILSTHLTGGAPRPPRPAEDFSSHPLADQFEALLDHTGDNDLSSLSPEELISYADALHEFEQARSHERRELFTRIDELSAELVRRYRDGEADVDGLLAADD